MITFIIGLLILLFGYLIYSRYVVSQFSPQDRETPAHKLYDGVDFVDLSKNRNALIQLLNIAGIGPILGAVQGILFGPIAFILIPLGCVLFGGVHDYFAGMISVRNDGEQITGLIKKYLGNNIFKVFIIIVSIMLLLLSAVFVFTSGDLIAQRFLSQNDFSLNNPIMVTLYLIIAFYYVGATLFPIDKIIGKLYPYFCGLLILGTGMIFVGFLIHGVDLQELDFNHINLHPNKEHILPMFFMTVSCGLLSGFHSTQSTIISRTLNSEYDGRRVFYGMMCIESVIAMIWAAGAMHVYGNNLVPNAVIGTANVVNIIADNFLPVICTFVVTLAVVVLPITSGDTALRGLRMILAEAFDFSQKKILNRFIIIIPMAILMLLVIAWAKGNSSGFSLIWRYFTFFNQLIAIPTLMFATVYLFKNGKNYFITLIPGLFYIFITASYILNAHIGFNLDNKVAKLIALAITFVFYILIKKKLKK